MLPKQSKQGELYMIIKPRFVVWEETELGETQWYVSECEDDPPETHSHVTDSLKSFNIA